jgi:hypothetical protein
MNDDGHISGFVRIGDGGGLAEQIHHDHSVLDTLDAPRDHLSDGKGMLAGRAARKQVQERRVMMARLTLRRRFRVARLTGTLPLAPTSPLPLARSSHIPRRSLRLGRWR